jgi:cell cycle arrest protein BUB3
MDLFENNLVVGLANRLIHIYDVRNTREPTQVRESSLKHQIRQIKCIPNGTGYATSSIEGRIAVDYFDQSPTVQGTKYSFKCHRTKEDDVELIYPVNALAYHPL